MRLILEIWRYSDYSLTVIFQMDCGSGRCIWDAVCGRKIPTTIQVRLQISIWLTTGQAHFPRSLCYSIQRFFLTLKMPLDLLTSHRLVFLPATYSQVNQDYPISQSMHLASVLGPCLTKIGKYWQVFPLSMLNYGKNQCRSNRTVVLNA